MSIYGHVLPELKLARQINSASTVAMNYLASNKGRDLVGNIKDAYGNAEATFKSFKMADSAGRALNALPAHMKTSEQLLYDVARLKASRHLAQMASNCGSEAARSAMTFMAPMVSQAENLLANERTMIRGYNTLLNSAGDFARGNLSQAAIAIEQTLNKVPFGRKIIEKGGMLSNPVLNTVMTGVGGLTAGWKAYEKSSIENRTGKLASAALTGAMAVGTDAAVALASKTNPLISPIDPTIKYGSKMLGASDEQSESMTLGKWAEGTADIYSSIAHSMLSGDSVPLDRLHKANMSGQNGRVIQGWAMIGDSLANLIDPAITKIVDWQHDVPQDYSKSKSWWGSL